MFTAPRCWSAFLVALLPLAAPCRASAQVQGRVEDAGGRPLSGALIELWSDAGRIANRVTDNAGRFAFHDEVAARATLITVRLIGYQPRRVELPQSLPLVISLMPFALQLPAITSVAPSPCPNAPDPAARALWEAAQRRYQRFEPGTGAWSPIRIQRARVSKENLGVVDTAHADTGNVAVGGDYFAMQSRRLVQRGYATPFQGLSQARFANWEYAWLDSFFAGHFLDSLLGTLHTFSFESHEPLVLRFCPRKREHPTIQGTVEFDTDSAPARATWVFLTEPPAEQAGGEVFFARPRPDEARPTIYPLVGLFWRKLVFDYYQEWIEFLSWHTCERDPDPVHCP